MGGPSGGYVRAGRHLARLGAAAAGQGRLWAFWSKRTETAWDIWGRMLDGDSWGEPTKISAEGSNTFHRAASTRDGKVVVAWQSAQGPAGRAHTDIWMRVWDGSWGNAMRVSESPANDWEPQVAGGPNGQAHIVWDSYDAGNYDVFYRSYANGSLGEIEQVTSSPRFQAHANVAVAPDGTPWLAWDESGTNWGKDHGYLITPPTCRPAAPGAFDSGRETIRGLLDRAKGRARAVLCLPALPQFRKPATRV